MITPPPKVRGCEEMMIRRFAAPINGLFELSPGRFMTWVITLNLSVIGLAVFFGLLRGNLLKQFGEISLPTLASFIQLLLTALICWRVFKLESARVAQDNRAARPTIWALFAAGFIYLALDEVLKLHERMDKWIHLAFRFERTVMTERFDDIIVALYMIGALVVLFNYRRVLWKFLGTWPFFACGFAAAAIMIGADFLGAYQRAMINLAGPDRPDLLVTLCGVLEDSSKIIAEGLFLSGYFKCHFLVRPPAEVTC